MFGQGDLPDFQGIFIVLAVGSIVGVVLGGYELIRLAGWIYNHVHIN